MGVFCIFAVMAQSVEKILLEFDADIKALKSDLDKAKKQLGEVETKGKSTSSLLTKSFKTVGGAIAAAFSVQVLIQFTKKAVELYDIQAKAEAGLLQALKGREDVQKRLLRQASDLQKVTLFGDEETIRAQTMLARFGMTETAIKRLIPLIQDYATLTGQDLVSAADMVARSVGTSTNALTRYGIEIEGAVGSSERLESAIENLSKQVGGQAVTAAEAGAGAVEQFNMAWGDFAETVGEDVLPAITAVTSELKTLLEAVMTLEDNERFFRRFFTEGAAGMLGFAKAAGEAREALGEVVTDEDIFEDQQERFIKWLAINRDGYDSLVDAGNAYLEGLDKQHRQNNRLLADGKQTQDSFKETQNRIVIAKDAVNTYVEDMSKGLVITDKMTKSTSDLSESFDKLPDDMTAAIVLMFTATTQLERMRDAANEVDDTNLAEFYIRLGDAIGDADSENQQFFENLKKGLEDARVTTDAWTQAWFNISSSIVGGLSSLSDQQTQKYISNLQAQLDAGRITADEFDRLQDERLRNNARKQKAAAIFDIILSTAQAIMNALTIKPASAAVPASIAAGVAGAVQLGVAVNAPLPAFAEGVVDLKGEGTETSDSIFARLSKGESVVTAKATRQDKGLFEAANKLELDKYINDNYVLPVLMKKQSDDKAMFDDYRLYRGLQDLKRGDKSNARMIVDAIKSEKINSRRYWA